MIIAKSEKLSGWYISATLTGIALNHSFFNFKSLICNFILKQFLQRVVLQGVFYFPIKMSLEMLGSYHLKIYLKILMVKHLINY